MKIITLAALAVAVSASPLLAAPISFLNTVNGVWSTGVNSSGTPLASGADPHYILLKLPTGCSVANANCQQDIGYQFGPQAHVVEGSDPVGSLWASNTAGSAWIGPRGDQATAFVGGATRTTAEIFGNDTDFYTYRLAFSLSALGLDPTTASIDLTYWTDDASTFVSGNDSHIRFCSIASAGDPTCSASSAVAGSVSSGATGAGTNVLINSGFTSGLMALDFIVYNANWTTTGFDNPSGLQVLINSATTGNVAAAVPEPGTLLLFGAGIIGLGAVGRRRRLKG